MNQTIIIEDDKLSNNVICAGLEQYLKDSGIKISKLKRISGLSRNTIIKMINEDPVRRATAEQLLDAMREADLLGDDLPKVDTVETGNVHRLWSSDDKQPSDTSDPDVVIVRLAQQLKALRDDYEALFEQAQINKGTVDPEELRVLRVRFGQVKVLHTELMELYAT